MAKVQNGEEILTKVSAPCSAVFSDFAALLQVLACDTGGWAKYFGERLGSDFFVNFMAQSCAFWSSLTLTRDKTVQNLYKFSSKFLCPLAAPCKVCGPPSIVVGCGALTTALSLWVGRTNVADDRRICDSKNPNVTLSHSGKRYHVNRLLDSNSWDW